MTTCIAFDASTERCSASLVHSGKIYSLVGLEARAHSQNLLKFTDELLKQHEIELSQLRYVACSIGPGSFTGLRIGFAIAQGLAYSLGIPLIGVSSLDALVQGGLALEKIDQEQVLFSVLDARMGEVYWCGYKLIDGKAIHRLVPQQLSSPEDAFQEMAGICKPFGLTNVMLLGPGAALINNPPHSTFKAVQRGISLFPHSREVALLAEQQWADGNFPEISELHLSYLRNSVSWNKRVRIRNPP